LGLLQAIFLLLGVFCDGRSSFFSWCNTIATGMPVGTRVQGEPEAKAGVRIGWKMKAKDLKKNRIEMKRTPVKSVESGFLVLWRKAEATHFCKTHNSSRPATVV